MTSAKGWLLSRLGRLLLREARIARVTPVGTAFRRIDIEGEALRGVAWEAGDKAQVLVPGTEVRTFTPLSWDAERGATAFLVLVRHHTPASEWGRTAAEGDSVRFIGPQRSLSVAGPVVLFGDETSFAVAHALRSTRTGPVSPVFEVASDDADVRAAYGLAEAPTIVRTADDRHLDAVTDALIAALVPGATLALTGRAQSIQGLRARLKDRGVGAPQKVKPYWSEGKRGLD